VAFASAVRAAGVAVTTDRTTTFLRAAALAGVADRSGFYWAGASALCSSPDDVQRYRQVFARWFDDARPGFQHRTAVTVTVTKAPVVTSHTDDARAAAEDLLRAAASRAEVLRSRDLAELSNAERAEAWRLFGALRTHSPTRRSSRRGPSRTGELDARRILRDAMRRGGESAGPTYRSRVTRPRRIVILIDVSGSMGPYADSLLRLAHVVATANPGRTEVFTMGTRLTRVTGAMRTRDGEAAVQAAGRTVPDWSGGTRLGDGLKSFEDRWGQRGAARGAVVVVMSDGWERGDCGLLSEQMARLHRLAHRVIWVNPHRGKAGYLPVQAGMAAALPYVDDFVAGHSIETFQAALDVVGRA
jgi:hypothetical protein